MSAPPHARTAAPTAAAPAGSAPPAGLGIGGWARWVWRQLTSMRVAIMLLLLLALVSLPGSLVPQRPQDQAGVAQFTQDNPGLSVWLDRLGFFDVYGSAWFSAVYLLLFVSLVGCIVPRTATYVRSLRAGPAAVPRSLARFPARATAATDQAPTAVIERARAHLGRRGVVRVDGTALSAETGRWHEAGNLLFHVALVGVLLAFGAGQVFSYRGQALVVEGESFANSVLDYDTFSAGTLVDPAALQPFTLRLDSFGSTFTADGQPRDFRAEVTTSAPERGTRTEQVRVNHPIELDDTRVYLSGNGYAPRLTVRDGAGEVALSGPVPFLPEDTSYTSRGVVKVPDVSGGQEQLGLVGALLPTAVVDDQGGLRSAHPEPNRPLIVFQVWEGDLGLDDGIPQNVYELDTDGMTQLTDEAGEPISIGLEPGQSADLPGGRGTITYEDTPRFASFDLRHDPTLGWLLWTTAAAMAGLIVSLGVTRRRVWVRVTDRPGGGADVEVAGLARGEDLGLQRVVDETLAAATGRPAPDPRAERVARVRAARGTMAAPTATRRPAPPARPAPPEDD